MIGIRLLLLYTFLKYHITIIILVNVEFKSIQKYKFADILPLLTFCLKYLQSRNYVFLIIVFPSFRYLKRQLFMMSNKNFTKCVSIFIYENLSIFFQIGSNFSLIEKFVYRTNIWKLCFETDIINNSVLSNS